MSSAEPVSGKEFLLHLMGIWTFIAIIAMRQTDNPNANWKDWTIAVSALVMQFSCVARFLRDRRSAKASKVAA